MILILKHASIQNFSHNDHFKSILMRLPYQSDKANRMGKKSTLFTSASEYTNVCACRFKPVFFPHTHTHAYNCMCAQASISVYFCFQNPLTLECKRQDTSPCSVNHKTVQSEYFTLYTHTHTRARTQDTHTHASLGWPICGAWGVQNGTFEKPKITSAEQTGLAEQ